jgi:histidinol-phosphate/aromatic aminotransferase/cobyric acid decarboxylase-like protein
LIFCISFLNNKVATTEGGIALCVAENKLMQEVLASRLMQQGTAITAFSDSTSYCHGSFLGLPQAREAAAYFLSKRFWKRHHDTGFGRGDGNSTYDSHLYMSPEYIAFGAGVNSLISQLFYSIASPGDVVLIPAPYYAGFEYDAKAIAGLEVHPVYAKNPVIGPSPTDLENAARSVEKVRRFTRTVQQSENNLLLCYLDKFNNSLFRSKGNG